MTTLTHLRRWLGITAIVLVVMIAFYLLGAMQAERTTSQPQLATAAPSPIPSASPPQRSRPEANTIPGWKGFSDRHSRYAIQYPSEWTLQESPNIAFLSPDIKLSRGTVVAGGEIVIFVEDYASPVRLSALYRNASNTGFLIIERKELVVNGLPALRYVAEGPGIDGTMTGLAIARGNRLYRLEAYYGRNDRATVVGHLDRLVSTLVVPAN